MRRAIRIFACLTVAVAVAAPAADETAQLQNRLHYTPFETVPETTTEFVARFKSALNGQLDDEFASRFHPLTTMNWSLRTGTFDPIARGDRAVITASQALSASFMDSLRSTTMDLPVVTWLEDRQEFLVDILENAFGNVGEEAVSPLAVSYEGAERSWWSRLSDTGGIHYGIRPFRTDPYAYFSWGIRDNGRVLLLGNARYHYVDFADHRFELSLSVPLARGCSIDVGTSYRFGQHEDASRIAVKFSRELKHKGILHLGLEVREHPTFIAGLTLPL